MISELNSSLPDGSNEGLMNLSEALNVSDTLNETLRETLSEICYVNRTSMPEWEENLIKYIEGYTLMVVGCCGIVGNILTVAVLHRISLNNVFNQLIVVLACVDSIFAAFSVLNYSIQKAFKVIQYTTPYYVHIWPVIVYPLQNITYSVTQFVTLAIAIERYMAICHPFLVQRSRSGASRCSHHVNADRIVKMANGNETNKLANGAKRGLIPGRAGAMTLVVRGSHGETPMLKKRTCHYLLPALLFSVIINIPKFLEFKTVDTRSNSTMGANATESEIQTIIVPTTMKLDQEYLRYYVQWFRMPFTAVIPFICLAVLNGKIIYKMRQTSHIMSNRDVSSSQKREAKLARTLVTIVSFFLICNVGKLALTIFDRSHQAEIAICENHRMLYKFPTWVTIMTSMNHLLLVINASANLGLIAATGTQFRATLMAMLRLRKPGISMPTGLTSYNPATTQTTQTSVGYV